MPALYTSLRRSLAVAARLGLRGQLIEQNEMALYSVLFETQDRTGLDQFLDSTIGALIAHDRRRGSELTATLLTYFDHKQNATETASRLGIHVNTVRQRLASIERLVGGWEDTARALEIHMALRLWKLGG